MMETLLLSSALSLVGTTNSPPPTDFRLPSQFSISPLSCSVGSPSPVITWFFNGTQLSDSDEIRQSINGELATLTFKDVFPDDTGSYEAVATNRLGEARTCCKLTVKDSKPPMTSPSFTKKLQDAVVFDGDSLTLKAHYIGTPEPKLTW